MTKIATDSITLVYSCPECATTARQPLTEIVESGTAVCTECEVDMELGDSVEIAK